VNLHELIVSNHQQFDDTYGHCQEFMSAFKNKLQMCQITRSDKHTIQICLDLANVSLFGFFLCSVYSTRFVRLHVMFWHMTFVVTLPQGLT